MHGAGQRVKQWLDRQAAGTRWPSADIVSRCGPRGSPGIHPVARAISVVNENVLAMCLTGSPGGELWARYLRVGHGPGPIWLDLIAAGCREASPTRRLLATA